MGASKKKKEEKEKNRYDLIVDGDEYTLGAFPYTVLSLVKEKYYAQAREQISAYKTIKFSFLPFKEKTEKMFKMIEEHIDNIEEKLNIKLTNMLAAQMEEILSSAFQSFEAIKILLKKIRTIERDFAAEDQKSIIIVVKAFLFAVVIIMATFLFKEINKSMGKTFHNFYQSAVRMLNP